MRRRLALNAEVLLRFHDAETEVALPVPIHGDPRGQWMTPLKEPLRQCQTIQGGVFWKWRQDRWNARLNLVGLIPIIASRENECLPRLLHLRHDHRRRDLLDEIVLLRLQRLELAISRSERLGCGIRQEVGA